MRGGITWIIVYSPTSYDFASNFGRQVRENADVKMNER